METAKGLEGIIAQRGIHASGVVISNSPYWEHNACMLSPRGDITTQFELHDSESMSMLKYDFLTINNLDMIRKTMDNLIADKYMEWQGSLRQTYDKYLHPNVLNYDDEKMWQNITKIPALFQFDTAVGSEAIKFVKPKNITELMTANSVMRLMASNNGESPLEQYVRYKNNIQKWYDDMRTYGLQQNEMDVLRKYLSTSYGIAETQEKVMLISMDKNVANFTLNESNKLRKAIAKKKFDVLQATEKMFYEYGKKNNVRQIFLKYVWDEVFAKSAGYAFSLLHVNSYTHIALQEMNLYTKYPTIYWNTAVLIVKSSSDEDNDDNKNTDYGKIATAIGSMQSQGTKIALPDINTAKFEFSPNVKNNQIIFGLKGISGIGDDLAKLIIENRPYTSVQEFIEKINISKSSMINLIKAGCFDGLSKSRNDLMKQYFQYLAQQENITKDNLTLQNLSSIESINIISKDKQIYIRYINFNKYITQKQFFVKKEKRKNYYKAIDEGFNFFEQEYIPYLKENVDYWYTDDGIIFIKSAYDKVFKKRKQEFIEYINTKEFIQKYNSTVYDQFIQENWNKYCNGNQSKWEMDSLSFYYSKHELADIDYQKYDIAKFNDVPKEPVVCGEYIRKNKAFPKYTLYKIAGTILDKNKNKHTISLLTTDGVVTVKFYDGAFIAYDKQLSVINDGKKQVIEKSWFARGNKLLITGIRRDDKFFPKRYYDSVYSHTVCLIKKVFDNGNLQLQLEREHI